jgi:hypothetical protein
LRRAVIGELIDPEACFSMEETSQLSHQLEDLKKRADSLRGYL